MKLVIDIPKERYEKYKRMGDSRYIFFEAICKGKPLDAALDEIRAEIIEKAKGTMNDTREEWLYMTLNIVDKYKAESGDKR